MGTCLFWIVSDKSDLYYLINFTSILEILCTVYCVTISTKSCMFGNNDIFQQFLARVMLQYFESKCRPKLFIGISSSFSKTHDKHRIQFSNSTSLRLNDMH